jgi:hypothetical protein
MHFTKSGANINKKHYPVKKKPGECPGFFFKSILIGLHGNEKGKEGL